MLIGSLLYQNHWQYLLKSLFIINSRLDYSTDECTKAVSSAYMKHLALKSANAKL